MTEQLFEKGRGVTLAYEVHGDLASQPVVLLIAPGGMRSERARWRALAWNPIERLAGDYAVVAMDQRNAGASSAPIGAEDGWHSYLEDQLALMDHLGCERFAVMGMCIGGPYCMGLMRAVPKRITGAVLFQPIGYDQNREAFYHMFDSWAAELRVTSHQDVPDAAWRSFRSNMYDGEFLFNMDRDRASQCSTPVLLFLGNDLYHPASTSRELQELLQNVRSVETWKDDPQRVDEEVRQFLQKISSSSSA